MSTDIITVGDIIERLEEFDENTPVVIKVCDRHTCGYVSQNALWLEREHSDDISIRICGDLDDYK